MHLAYHGGKCCGIKTIYGFPGDPASIVNRVYYHGREEVNSDSHGDHVSTNSRFYHGSAPSETGLERLDRYLRYCDQRRPGGVIEIVLADYRFLPTFTAAWWPVLEERGFTKTAEFRNSNSDNMCTVYHRVKSAPRCEQPDFDDFIAEWDEKEGADKEVPELCDCGCGMPIDDC